jgi:hypothetical protein
VNRLAISRTYARRSRRAELVGHPLPLGVVEPFLFPSCELVTFSFDERLDLPPDRAVGLDVVAGEVHLQLLRRLTTTPPVPNW